MKVYLCVVYEIETDVIARAIILIILIIKWLFCDFEETFSKITEIDSIYDIQECWG